MPHDSKGALLEVGDEVTLLAVVDSISSGEDFCNLTVKSQLGRKPDGNKETFTLNAAVVQKYSIDDCEPEASAAPGGPPPNPDFTIVQCGEQQGAWVRKGDATLAVVYKCPGQEHPYVCIYPQTIVAQTPYAMFIDDKGQLTLQLPPTATRLAPLQVSMARLEALLDAAVPIQL